MVSYNYNPRRYRTPSMSYQLTESWNANKKLREELDAALRQIKSLETEVSRLERELANRG